MDSHISIIKLGSRDIEYAKSLFGIFLKENEPEYLEMPSDEYFSGMLQKKDFHILVAIVENKVVGGLTAYELPMFMKEIHEMFLYDIAVDHAFQRKGLAKALIESLKNLCLAIDIQYMYVGTEKHNLAAMKLYENTGGISDDNIAWFNYDFDK